MRRRDFITLIGTAAAAWPLAAHAQQTEKPVIGFLDGRLPDALANRLPGFHRGLREAGYVEGENVTVLYRYAENQIDRLPALTDELTRRPVAVIVASGGPNVISAAKKATTTIPIVFLSGEDPARLGLVASLARPGGNLTGINFFNRELVGKQLGFLRELVLSANRIAVLVNPASTVVTETTLREAESTARVKELKIQVVHASTSREIDAAFAAFERDRPDALFVAADPFFNSRRLQLSLLAMRHAVPAIYSGREYAEVGGLITYGSDIADAYRQAGIYVGRILKGAKPEDMPVVQVNKLELIINAQSARALGLAVPQSLLVAADEVIE
ncbi:MAG: ABC transporter substrate-binding protein [Pseudolabrys sp.]|jgi:putative ABC transport system substrate-binding protein